jgi:hypothetical protein
MKGTDNLLALSLLDSSTDVPKKRAKLNLKGDLCLLNTIYSTYLVFTMAHSSGYLSVVTPLLSCKLVTCMVILFTFPLVVDC